MNKYSFKKGFSQIQLKDTAEVRRRITEALNLNPESRASWKLRIDGTVEPKVSEAQAIEAIFHDYAIFEIWGS